MSTALEIEHLSYTYRTEWTRRTVTALKDLSLVVNEGESFGFLGHNGAGKTTAIKAILGLTKPSAGSIKVFGVDSRDARARASVGYLPEQPYFYDYLSVEETVDLYATLAGLGRAERREAVSAALAIVGMESRRRSKMRALSKGLTQRVALAQAIVAKPRLLILDEPFSGLDPLGRREFREIFEGLRKGGTTLFMSSHVLSDVEFLCDRASILVNGELKGVYEMRSLPVSGAGYFEILVRRFEEIFHELSAKAAHVDTHHGALRLRFQERADAVHALGLALERGAQVDAFQFHHGTLEDLFMSVVQESRSVR